MTPDHPAGLFEPVAEYSQDVRQSLTAEIAGAPSQLEAAVDGLNDTQLNTPYRNWTIRQIVHHLADSHVHSYIRFKWALTEDNPTIKAYEEAAWVQLSDCQSGSIQPSLALIEGLHAKWVQLLNSMSADDFRKTFVHPQTGETVSLWLALNYYPWHSLHHTGQILWLRQHNGWD